MKEQELITLAEMDKKLQEEKIKIYRNGIVLLPGIATITTGALANNNVCMAVGATILAGGAALTSKSVRKIYTKNRK